MSSSPQHSNLRVFVTFKEDTIFAGETVEATITFKNVPVTSTSPAPVRSRTGAAPSPRPPSIASNVLSGLSHSRQASVASQVTRRPHDGSPTPRTGHRHALSLNLKNFSPPHDESDSPTFGGRRGKAHGRSVSIVSLGSGVGGPNIGGHAAGQRNPARPGFKLARSASVQVSPTSTGSPRWNGTASMPGRLPSMRHFISDEPTTGPTVGRPHRSPLSATVSRGELPWGRSIDVPVLDESKQENGRPSDSKPGLPHTRSSSARLPQSSRFPVSSFRFPPAAQNGTPKSPSDALQDGLSLEVEGYSTRTGSSPTRRRELPQVLEPRVNSPDLKPPPLNRVMSLASDHGTARSSLDLYSTSNHSDETVISEYLQDPVSGLLGRSPSSRGSPQPERSGRQPQEVLMMGFAQLYGCFTLDGSLVNQAPFEDVKRRAVVGGQGGGGVVGIERGKAESGLFGSLGWGTFGESLGGLLGSSEPSSIREMKGVAQSKSIPLLTTPKSILFVDLKLEPGESRSYTYSFALPRGLPPSHRGRAMKVAYQIVVGTQRPGSNRIAQEQQIRQVEVPFRVFGGVDGQGEILGHDLMSPYVVLRDQARITALEHDASGESVPQITAKTNDPKSSEADFNAYIADLLSNARQNTPAGLLSPTQSIPNTPRGNGTFPTSNRGEPPSTRALIDNAIRMSIRPVQQRNDRWSPQPSTSQTNFTIARAGTPIAQLMLSRPALRLGDLLHLALDFSPPGPSSSTAFSSPPIVQAVTLTLESSESVDAALAIRSLASVERATRRVWDRRVIGGANAAALTWCKRWSSSFKVPSAATPGFATTGVSVSWFVRVEIAVSFVPRPQNADAGTTRDRSDGQEGGNRVEAEGEGEKDRMIMPASNLSQQQLDQYPRGKADQLLELVASDDRGRTHAARQWVQVESFEIAVPIRVFGAVGAAGGDDVAAERGGDEGLRI